MSTEPVPTPVQRLQQLRNDEVQAIAATEHLDATVHQWSQAEIDALTLALAARRPLLVRGEPGTGKTQLARAAACHLGWALHAVTIHPRFEPSDLIYRFDAVKRLADAQAGKLQDDTHYWDPGPLWKAFGWTAACHYGSCRVNRGQAEPAGHVVLIDEIDKADSDLPNSLLEVLGQRAFEIAALGIRFGTPGGQQPLILITTNEERELPAAFIRRCVVLSLEPGRDYAAWLLKRGRAHFGRPPYAMSDDILRGAAHCLVVDREQAASTGLPPPGLAEYIDLLSALHDLAANDKEKQTEWMERLRAYAFVKHRQSEGVPGLSQSPHFSDGPPPGDAAR